MGTDNIRAFFVVFASVFVAELGDKTQLATMLFASKQSRALVFAAAATALVVSSAVAVLAGGWLGRAMSPRTLSWIAGLGFIAIGIVTIVKST